MDDQRIGAAVRAVRCKKGLRQVDVAELAGVDQASVSRLERGWLRLLSIEATRKISAALEIDLSMTARWRGGDLDRLLDRDHAALVEEAVRELAEAGWQTLPEYTFSVYGERGSVDVVGWDAKARRLAITEVKSRITDEQDLLSTTDRKRRLVPPLLARERGWRAAIVMVLLVVADTTFNRTVMRRHQATYAASFPMRTREVRGWLREPASPSLQGSVGTPGRPGTAGGILFVRPMQRAHGKRGGGGPDRIRRPRQPETASDPSVAPSQDD